MKFIRYFLLFNIAISSVIIAQEVKSGQTASESGNGEKTSQQDIEKQEIDEVSITATRVKRKTQDVPASMVVVGEDKIEDSKMHNVKDAMAGAAGVQVDSKNGGSDTRLIIRGAGAKARFGIREIMILLNGVPITDPDGFSKLDMIDPVQIERIEVVKGPNSTLWGVNSAGGVVNIITKDPVKSPGGSLRVGYGAFGSGDTSIYYGNHIGNSFVYSLGASYINSDNSWRDWNKYTGYNVTFQPGIIFTNGGFWQNYVSYNKSDTQLPGSLSEEGFTAYLGSKRAPESDSLFRRSGRYADNLFISSKLEKEFGNLALKPMLFFTRWTHYHPVFGFINEAEAYTFGADLQFDFKHTPGLLTFGTTSRVDYQNGLKYKYGNIDSHTGLVDGLPVEYIDYIHSDAAGDIASDSTSTTFLLGVYAQESLNLFKKLTVDIGVRYDHILFDNSGNIYSYYNYAQSAYQVCSATTTNCGLDVANHFYRIEKSFDQFSPRVGVSYQIAEPISVFGNISRGLQTPTSGEIESNPELDIVTSMNYEVGFKGRAKSWEFETSAFINDLENEVISILNTDGTTDYSNAGKTRKIGFEFAGAFTLFKVLGIGGTFTYNDFRYTDFTELVRSGSTLVPIDRAGQRIPFSPEYMFSLFAQLKLDSGFKVRVQSDTWGPYFVDNANSAQYDGYFFITKVMLGYKHNNLNFSFNVENIFDTRYAIEVTRASTVDNTGAKTYSPAPPRSFMASISCSF